MPEPAETTRLADSEIEIRIIQTGSDLVESLGRVLSAVPDSPQGPQALAKRINVDKVLASRLLRAVKSSDEMSALHRFPGPEPLRRVLKGASKVGVDAGLIDSAERAIDRFAGLIRDDLGDRGALDAIISAWVPEARRDFEIRWKQSAYKAMSQLKGVRADATLATAIIHPSSDGEHLDVVWLSGLIGLQRLRPGALVKLATRRFIANGDGRRPLSLDGREIDGYADAAVEAFSSTPMPRMEVHRVGEVMHYTLDADGFGPKSSQDLVLAEVNLAEMRRYLRPEEDRQGFFFAESAQPTKVLQFDAILHDDVYPGSEPRLHVYDTALDGVADVNDPSRDLDRLELLESVEPLGRTVDRIGSSVIPRYGTLIRHVFDQLGWERSAFRVHRSRIDYPVYGSQVAMCFDPPRRG
ncbi:MAG: hypothetical protein H6810_03735 [Phycisphaeraceae bacterium]|nr:MAG: hypothetical protein H6810_03735 [Phycisphaeraceae bacterium]